MITPATILAIRDGIKAEKDYHLRYILSGIVDSTLKGIKYTKEYSSYLPTKIKESVIPELKNRGFKVEVERYWYSDINKGDELIVSL